MTDWSDVEEVMGLVALAPPICKCDGCRQRLSDLDFYLTYFMCECEDREDCFIDATSCAICIERLRHALEEDANACQFQ